MAFGLVQAFASRLYHEQLVDREHNYFRGSWGLQNSELDDLVLLVSKPEVLPLSHEYFPRHRKQLCCHHVVGGIRPAVQHCVVDHRVIGIVV